MEIKYINSLGNKTKIQGIPRGEEKQRGGEARGRETRCLSKHLFPSDKQTATNSQNHGGFVSFESENSGEKWMLIRQ